MATAKHRDCAPRMIAVFTPITSPCESTRGPPELPGFSDASVWITLGISRPVPERMLRPSALTIPAVTVCSKPSGLPIAIAICPRRNERVLPSCRERQRTAGSLVDTQYREVGVRVVADPAGCELLAVVQRDPEAHGLAGRLRAAGAHDVRVRQQVAVRCDDEAGTAAGGAALADMPSAKRTNTSE
jgi:hypothetical protein